MKALKILFFFIFLTLLSQVETKAQFSGTGNDQVYQSAIQLEYLTQIPTYHSDMPLDCMVGYIVMDSLSRNEYGVPIFDFIEGTSIDTIKVVARYLYSVCDYNPTLLRSYINTLRDSFPGPTFKSSPSNTYYKTQQEISKRINEFGKDFAFLIVSHYILRIRVDSVVVGVDTTFNETMNWVNVASTVLEKIKGIYLPENCHYDNNKINNAILDSYQCLLFGYPFEAKTGPRDEVYEYPPGIIRTVVKGEEYFVFLEHISMQKGTDYIHPVYKFEQSGGLFKIENENVLDPSNFWGLGTQPSIEDFRNNLNDKISIIKHWWIP
ncbi:MAG: hypothetical protein EPN82_10405 [Bacteroidetes bacterium]|nr:MAG: hypothetical protein EPN82_10405 [Bacteroidota bacterium]